MSRVYICGLGASGEAVARLAVSLGSKVTLVDRSDSPACERMRDSLERLGVDVQTGCSRADPAGHDLCIVSPGIPIDSEWLVSGDVPVLSTMEYAWRFCETRVIAVTGSNGKSTFVKLCAEALEASGARVAIAGNYGRPLADVVLDDQRYDWIVLEVSSFQLEAVSEFRPDIGVWLNLLPNHLDRHGTMDVYGEMKARLFANQEEGDVAVVGVDLESRVDGAVTFGHIAAADYRVTDGVIRGPKVCVDLTGTPFENGVLAESAAGVAAVLDACGVPSGCLEEAAKRFRPLPHRLAVVGTVGEVLFIDDSKATNLAALGAAVRSQSAPVRLIAGGVLKEKDLESVKVLLAKHVVAVYLIGEAANELAEAWGEHVTCTNSRVLTQAVSEAWRESTPGDVVLLSPGCASFDQFANFADRGNAFLECVRALKKEK